MHTDETILKFYSKYNEDIRLKSGEALIEFERTKEIISRYMIQKELKILDAGGGTGPYSFWLSSLGHSVTLLDPVEKHIKIAMERNEKNPSPLKEIITGDARQLPFEDGSFDVILNLGPMYHLQDREERKKVLREIKRVGKTSGTVFTAIISRYASLLDGFREGFIKDEKFVNIMYEDIKTGCHECREGQNYFTTAYLQHPDEIIKELQEEGFYGNRPYALESFAWVMSKMDEFLQNEKYKKILYDSIRMVEEEKSLMGISAHILVVSKCGINDPAGSKA